MTTTTKGASKTLTAKQRNVHKRLKRGDAPADIAKSLKITVHGVYGHMRRIEAAGHDLSRYRSRNGSQKKTGRKRPRQAAASNGHSPTGAERFLKTLDNEESALKDEAEDLKADIESATKRLAKVGDALSGVEAARAKLR